MSDDQNNDDLMKGQTGMQAEWSRVVGNPDNLIVSDVLRSALPDEYTSGENTSRMLELAVKIGELEIVAPLTRMDMSKRAWLCQMSVDASDAAVILSYTLDEICSAKVELKDKGNTINTFETGANGDLALSVDTDGRTYFITLTCEKNLENSDGSK